MKLPLEEKHLYSKAHFLDEISVALGGYLAEKMIFGDITTGASDDLRHAMEIARALVMKYGMSEAIGPVAWGGRSEPIFLGKDFMAEKNYSEEVAKEIDAEITKIINNSKKAAEDVLLKNKELLADIANTLVEKETIENEEFNAIISKRGIKVKKLEII